MKAPRSKTHSSCNWLRIIAGEWRGRRIEFSAAPGLRPTPDRVRETLFNWLQPRIEGARCLDLFTGSGALALEALSRGAASATLVDSSSAVLDELRRNLAKLGAQGADLVCADAVAWLQRTAGHCYDIVFIDPPYRLGQASRCVQALQDSGLLAANAAIYVETASDEPAPHTPGNWVLHRDRHAGQVAYRLYLKQH